jgi:3-methyladenine DNA glycosylase AlkD
MHPEHRLLRAALQGLAGTGSTDHHGSGAYTGSPHPALGVSTPAMRRLAREWLAAHEALSPDEILAVADSLFAGDVLDEHTLAALIVGYSGRARRATTPERFDLWLDSLVGWAEIDALCSNAFQAEDFLADWSLWGGYLRWLATDSDINKRRASLVLLTGPVRRSDDERLGETAFANVAALQRERATLITKAVSWLLRNLIAHSRDDVVRYLEANRSVLPAIAVREVLAKLETGRKSRRTSGTPMGA